MNQESKKIRLFKFLINPFNTIAGGRSLLIGLAVVLVTAVLAFLFSTHFTGVLDVKYGQLNIGVHNYLLYPFVNVLIVSVFVYIAGLLVSKSSIRFIDIIGTQALARFPLLITPFMNVGNTMEVFSQFMMNRYLSQGEPATLSVVQWGYVVIGFLVLILAIIWMVVLMYNSYRVSCNVKGAKAIVSFAIALVLAEVLSLFANSFQVRIFV